MNTRRIFNRAFRPFIDKEQEWRCYHFVSIPDFERNKSYICYFAHIFQSIISCLYNNGFTVSIKYVVETFNDVEYSVEYIITASYNNDKCIVFHLLFDTNIDDYYYVSPQIKCFFLKNCINSKYHFQLNELKFRGDIYSPFQEDGELYLNEIETNFNCGQNDYNYHGEMEFEIVVFPIWYNKDKFVLREYCIETENKIRNNNSNEDILIQMLERLCVEIKTPFIPYKRASDIP